MTVDVCVVGSFMMDLVFTAPRRPATGETLVGTSFEQILGGKGFNQAVAAARSGATTAMVGAVGDDAFGEQFLAALAREGIDATHVARLAGGTGVASPLVEESGANSIVIIPRANHAVTVADIDAAASVLAQAKVVLLQCELLADVAAHAAAVAKRAGTTVILNPAPAVVPLDRFAGSVDIVIPNETEIAQLTGVEDDPSAGARAVMEATGARAVVVTLGEKGICVVGASEEGPLGVEFGEHRVPSCDVDCIDTVGAGDAFCGAFAACIADGVSLADAAIYGNGAGGLAVTVRGAEPAMPRRADIERLLLRGADAPTP